MDIRLDLTSYCWGLSVLQGECHADAVACRLHLTLASLPFGKHARPPWDVAKQLLEYSSKRQASTGWHHDFDVGEVSPGRQVSDRLIHNLFPMLLHGPNLQPGTLSQHHAPCHLSKSCYFTIYPSCRQHETMRMVGWPGTMTSCLEEKSDCNNQTLMWIGRIWQNIDI